MADELTATDKVRNLRDVQGQNGTWDMDEYMRGLYNGLELALSVLEGERDPVFRSEPASGYRKPKIVLNIGHPPFADKGQA